MVEILAGPIAVDGIVLCQLAELLLTAHVAESRIALSGHANKAAGGDDPPKLRSLGLVDGWRQMREDAVGVDEAEQAAHRLRRFVTREPILLHRIEQDAEELSDGV